MIYVTDNYFIVPTQYGYNVAKPQKPDKDGRPKWENIAYYTTLMNAMDGLKNLVQRERLLAAGDIDFDEAIEIIVKLNKEFQMLIDDVKERIGDV